MSGYFHYRSENVLRLRFPPPFPIPFATPREKFAPSAICLRQEFRRERAESTARDASRVDMHPTVCFLRLTRVCTRMAVSGRFWKLEVRGCRAEARGCEGRLTERGRKLYRLERVAILGFVRVAHASNRPRVPIRSG